MATAKPSHEPETAAESQQLFAGRFRLSTQIGRGRLGDIYEAEDVGRRELGIAEHAAVQVLAEPIAQNNSLFDKLELGYTVLRNAAHPSIVSYLDIGRDGRFGYVVMELLAGASMRTVLDTYPKLPLEEVVPLLRALGDALQFLHSKSIVHGRVTAENVFVDCDLDVRLLDVVPLASSDAVLRGVAEHDPLNRGSVHEDVFALACLTYEMLAGKHPYNFESLTDVMKAGLQPARIQSLPEEQWTALRRTLVANQDESILTVAEFLHEFGVSGTERLRDLKDKEAPSPGKAVPKPATEIRAPKPHRRTRTKRRLRPAALFISLVGLGAWYVYGEPSDRIVALLETFPTFTVTEDPEPVALAAVSTTSDVEEAHTVESALDAENPEPEASAAVAEPDSLPQQAPVAHVEASDFAFEESVVTVSERDAVARITVRRPATQADDIAWWTTAHAAIPDEDYIVLSGRLPGSEADTRMTSLHIPLVNDNRSEQLEDFFVHLGRRDNPGGRLVPIDTLRVDIVDDD